MLYVLILTVVVNHSAPSTTSIQFATESACLQAGRSHSVAVEKADVRGKVMYSCVPRQ